MTVYRILISCAVLAVAAIAAVPAISQSMPATAGETLSGKHIVLADAVRGHSAVLVAGFSHEGGTQTGDWMKAIHADSALSGVDAYQVAMLGGAPSFIRGTIKSGMRKGLSNAQQDWVIVITQDQDQWKKYFDVSDDKVPYVMLLDGQGNVLWHGHGSPDGQEAQLRAVVPSAK